MCCIEGSKLRHPAGKLRKVAEASPHSLGWALAKSAELGAKRREDEIIKLLTTKGIGCPCGCRYWINTEILITLIRSASK